MNTAGFSKNFSETIAILGISLILVGVLLASKLTTSPKRPTPEKAADSTSLIEQPMTFEDPTYQKELGEITVKDDLSVFKPRATASLEEQLQTVSEITQITYHPVVFAIEKQTLVKYPDAESRIRGAFDEANSRMSAAGILRRYTLDRFTPVYDKNINTNCKAINILGKNLPSEFCSHSPDYIFVAVDETGGSNYAHRDKTSLEWHGYNGLFGSQGVSVLTHELGHILGLPDMYHISIDSQHNLVNGQTYKPFSGYIMHNLTPGNFHPWDAQIVNREKKTFPSYWNTWLNYQPKSNLIRVKGLDNCLIEGANVNVFSSDPGAATGGLIDTVSDFSGITNSSGEISIGSNPLGTDGFKALRAFLVKIEKDGKTDYGWFDTTDVNFAYWNGDGLSASYTVTTENITCPLNPRPDVCTSSSKSAQTLDRVNEVQITISGSPPNGTRISSFILNFYNLDNLSGPGNPRPVVFDGSNFLETICLRSGNSCTFVVTFSELDRIDEATGKYPTNIQVNGYFILDDGRTSAADGKCVQQFSVSRAFIATPTPTKKPTPTATKVPTPTPTKKTSATPTKSLTNTPSLVSAGDANGDGKVDGFDYVIWWQNFNRQVSGGPSKGDYDSSGFVDGFDYVIWWQNFGT